MLDHRCQGVAGCLASEGWNGVEEEPGAWGAQHVCGSLPTPLEG